MLIYAACVFLSSFLLFQIETMISKTLLPWFGGTPAVWSSTMMFFQILLAGGYAYANWLVGHQRVDYQKRIHISLMGITICLIIFLAIIWPTPITPAASWRPKDITDPIFKIFLILLISVGLPFFVLSTNSSLMQSWYSLKNPRRSPYWLYALSNIGSLLGLLTYPTIFEPLLTRQIQGWIWVGCYFAFSLLVGIIAFRTTFGNPKTAPLNQGPESEGENKLSLRVQVLWILLSACPSILVLAVTSQITQEVAPIPLLWVLPLAIYLLTFIFAFSSNQFYSRKLFIFLFILGTAGWFYVILNPYANFVIGIIFYSFLLFTASMVCHSELYNLRPHPSQLTRFYLLVSIGGALGALFVNLVAPSIFPGYWELYVGAGLVWIILAYLTFPRKGRETSPGYGTLVGAIAAVVSVFMIFLMIISTSGKLFTRRNFFGVVRVGQISVGKDRNEVNTLYHGSTIHGFQFLKSDMRQVPTAYFSRTSGIGLAITNHPKYDQSMRVGVLGLGVGTLTAYGQPGDYYRIYEINPVVADLANGYGNYFSFIKDSKAKVDIILGDARISLENELKDGIDNKFDILVLDVFSSDSVPTHLVTKEAFNIYLQNMAPDGLFAANVSNVRLDMRPVFWQLAQYYHMDMEVIHNPATPDDPASFTSTWILLTKNHSLIEAPELMERMASDNDFRSNIRLWTDDYSNLVQILK